MELTKEEHQLLVAARKNPGIAASWIFVAIGMVLVAAVGGELITTGTLQWDRLDRVLIWLMFCSVMYTQTKFMRTAYSLIAKLDGSDNSNVPVPAVLGLNDPPSQPSTRIS